MAQFLRRVRVGDAREARRRAPFLVQDPLHVEAARALLGLGAGHRVGGDVEAVVGEARQRNAVLGVLSSHTDRLSGARRGVGLKGEAVAL